MDFKRIVLAALAWLLAGSVSAAQIDNLYQITKAVPATQQGAPAAEQLSAGLEQVLVKVTGRTDLSTNAVIKAQLNAALDYLQQFRYEMLPTGEAQAQQQSLVMEFNQIAVEGLIKHAGLKQLGVQRPTVLLWIASDQGGQQEYLSGDSAVIQQLRQEATNRGLPVQLPIYDLEDQTSLPVSDLWGLFNESILQASARYTPDAVIAARIQTTAAGFNQMEWILISGTTPERRSTAGALTDIIPELVHTTADKLFAASVNPVRYDLSYFQKGTAINISNIKSLSNYIHVTDYIKSLPVVSKIKPESVRGSDITVRLELDGSSALLKETLALEPRLQALDYSRAADGTETLHYYWQE